MNRMRVQPYNRDEGGWVVTQYRGMDIWQKVRNSPSFEFESDAVTYMEELRDACINKTD